MQLAPDVAQFLNERLFDVHMNVFERGRILEIARLDTRFNRQKLPFDRFEFLVRENSDVREHARVPDRAANILRVHAAVETNALAELLHLRVGRFGKDSAPRFGDFIRILCHIFVWTPTLTPAFLSLRFVVQSSSGATRKFSGKRAKHAPHESPTPNPTRSAREPG